VLSQGRSKRWLFGLDLNFSAQLLKEEFLFKSSSTEGKKLK